MTNRLNMILKKSFKLVCLYLFGAFCSIVLSSCASHNNQTAGTFAPNSYNHDSAVIQVYGARTKGTKKILAVHTWISVKAQGEADYTSYEIIGWRLRRTGSALVERSGNPDRDWWGHQPELLLDIRGERAQRLIPEIKKAVEAYPHKNNYHAWPGPNSNTFTAFIGRQVPELGLDLPSTAIGKDYREISESVGLSASGTGVQASLWGLLGLAIGSEEGLELNLLGLNFEFDLLDLAIELPGIGRIGASDVDDPKEQEPAPRNLSQGTEIIAGEKED